jgi:hypothetical protein
MTPPFASLKIGCFVSGSLRRLRRRAEIKHKNRLRLP